SFASRTRILGAGAATQFDTRVAREQLIGTPIALFLQQSSQVDVLIDGRLISSQIINAGNQLLDTSTLPEGSYSIVLRITEPGRPSRDEVRFFIKDSRIAPVGQTVFQAFAGVLAPTRPNQIVHLTDTFYYQAGVAKRLSRRLGVDGTLLGTTTKALGEVGLYYMTRQARARIAGLVSSNGEVGALAQVNTTGSGPAHLSFDIRKIWGGGKKPLIPGTYDGSGFDAKNGNGLGRVGNDYLQINAAAGLRLGPANFRLFASYFDAGGARPEYSVGPSFDWLFLQKQRAQLRLEGDAQWTRHSRSAYLGVRFLLSANRAAVSGSTGYRSQKLDHGGVRERVVGTIDAQWSDQADSLGRYTVGAGIDRTPDRTAARGSASLFTDYGNGRADVIHDFSGSTQYGVSITTGAVFGGSSLKVGGRNVNESAVLVAVDGKDAHATFDVIVNDSPVAKVQSGKKAALFLTPYRRYDIRVRQAGNALLNYDATARRVTLFPGSVSTLSWDAAKVRTIYGRLIARDGSPIRNAVLHGKYGVGQSNDEGYFQIDTGAGDDINLHREDIAQCRVDLPEIGTAGEYQPIGDVQCR
ncbi:MAG TPA: TcfC E-set like domain-containing protein, partial [Terriglobia bacterium]